jgi:hypothetical protein
MVNQLCGINYCQYYSNAANYQNQKKPGNANFAILAAKLPPKGGCYFLGFLWKPWKNPVHPVNPVRKKCLRWNLSLKHVL